jgi:DNA-binding response OmpR family regulator
MAKILIVDDEPEIRHLLASYVQQEGHVALTAADADSARAELKNEPSLILLDIDLPKETGTTFAIRLSMEENTSHIPIVFVTAYPDRVALLRAKDIGKADVITKPFHRKDITNILHKYLP